MRNFAKIVPTFWTRGDGKALRGDSDAQVLALYLFTGPNSSAIGLYHLALPTMSHETGLPLEGARKALARVSEGAIAYYDEVAELVWVPNMARYQIAEKLTKTDKQRAYVTKEVLKFKGHPYFEHFVFMYREPYNLDPSMGLGRPLEGASEALRRVNHSKTEMESKTESKTETETEKEREFEGEKTATPISGPTEVDGPLTVRNEKEKSTVFFTPGEEEDALCRRIIDWCMRPEFNTRTTRPTLKTKLLSKMATQGTERVRSLFEFVANGSPDPHPRCFWERLDGDVSQSPNHARAEVG